MSHRRSLALAFTLALAACVATRDREEDAPPWDSEVAPLLRAKCARCHAEAAPAGGWRSDSYPDAICSPVLAALDRPDHAALVTSDERSRLERWLAGGTPSTRPGTHHAGFLDPRSQESHGNVLRAKAYRPMLDAEDADACGRCHEGVVAKPGGLAFAAPRATSCTTCHDEPGGALGCGTCHGSRGQLSPPRDPCFHPADAKDHAHGAHVRPSASRAEGLACSACHPQPVVGDLARQDGTHANGFVDVACAPTCHARGGAKPSPAWTDRGPMSCSDCHASPPANHYRGACTSCHREANAGGTALTSPRLHANGRVDLGDGSGKCGACHGNGDEPWPSTGAHAAHARPTGAKPVACETCHEVPDPSRGERHPIGREGGVAVRLAGLATSGGRRASFDAATKTCAGTYCHEGVGATIAAPRWNEGAAARACGSCHASPPPAPHPQVTTCEQCHAGEAKSTHVDGLVTR